MSSLDTQLDYVAAGSERLLMLAAIEQATPVMLLGPTGCGKTQLVESVAAELGRALVTVSCHDDMTTADLVGRHLIRGGDVEWSDGPLTRAMRIGALCYLDEVVEARSDTLAVLHSVTDHRRRLFIDRLDEELQASSGFLVIASYNPRPLGSPKAVRASLRQRFATIEIGYLPADSEARVVADRSRVCARDADRLVRVANVLRDAAAQRPGRFDPPSTRTLILAGGLIVAGRPVAEAVQASVLGSISADGTTAVALSELVRAALAE